VTVVKNTDTLTRIWGSLVNNETGATLELRSGESADTTLPKGFTDEYLMVQSTVHAKSPTRSGEPAASHGTTSTPAPAETVKE
jgi:hypothetical protein